MEQVRTELKRTGTISLNDTDVRKLAGKTSGTISMNDLRGKKASESVTDYVLLNERPYPNVWDAVPNRVANYNMEIPHKIIKGSLSVTIRANKGGLSSNVEHIDNAYVQISGIGTVETGEGTVSKVFNVSNLNGSLPVKLFCGKLWFNYSQQFSYDTSVVIKFTGEWEL